MHGLPLRFRSADQLEKFGIHRFTSYGGSALAWGAEENSVERIQLRSAFASESPSTSSSGKYVYEGSWWTNSHPGVASTSSCVESGVNVRFPILHTRLRRESMRRRNPTPQMQFGVNPDGAFMNHAELAMLAQ